MMSDGNPTWLTTGQCAARLGVSPDFVLGEIRDRRLVASVIVRDGKRIVYRVTAANFETYLHRHHGSAEYVVK